MARATFHSLTQKEQALVAETRREALAPMDEDALGDLLVRVRRARDKAVGLHRREVAQRVSDKGARGAASEPPRRSASKAEIFEDALARVSAALAKAARQSAAALKAERLAAARGTAAPVPAATARPPRKDAGGTPATGARRRRPVERKTTAATRASGARRQAARDAR